MKGYGGSRGTAPLIPNLDARWIRAVKFPPPKFYSNLRIPVPIWSQSLSIWFWKTENPLPLQGSQLQTVQILACRYTDYDVRGQMMFADFKALVLKILVL
jgi:hypothetical protein